MYKNDGDSQSLALQAHHLLGERGVETGHYGAMCLVLNISHKGLGDPEEEAIGTAWGVERKALCK